MIEAWFECTCGCRKFVGRGVDSLRVSVFTIREVSYESCDKCGKYNETSLLIEEEQKASLVIIDETVKH